MLETRARQALTDRDHREALGLCRAGRELVAAGTSAHVQLAVQEARTSARLGFVDETRRLLDEAAASLDRMPTPEHPEHRFHFDAQKLVGYTATTLAWLRADLGEAGSYARRAVDQYDIGAADGRWLRRLALARIDLALVLAADDQPEEAVHHMGLALDSGRLVPANLWRLTELDHELAGYGRSAGVPEMHDRYVDVHRQLVGVPPGAPSMRDG